MRFRRNQKPKLGIELTPLIDVVFLLLIFFMVSTTFVANPGIKVNLPEASSRPVSEKPETIEITLTKEKRVYLGGQEVALEGLKSGLAERVKQQGEAPSLLIRADGEVAHAQVVFVMDQAYQVGISQLSIATTEPGM